MARVDPVEFYELHARLCKAIADPKRLLIINELRDGPRSVNEIAQDLSISQPNVSQHLALLRSRGVVTSERRGSQVYYGLTSDKIVQALDLLRAFMAEELGRQTALHHAAG
jgi:ArsR family transcriptional regulator